MAKKALLFSLLLLLSFRLFAIDPVKLYVSKLGKSGAIGTQELPFSNLASAVEKAGALKNRKVIINIAKGTYYLDETLKISSSAFHANSLEILGATDGETIISAGRKLQLVWKENSNGIMSAVVPQGVVFERLYLNNKLQILARYPNFD